MSVVLADLGGTNLRLARGDDISSISTFRIKDYPSFESVLTEYAPDISALYLASAVTPLKGVIEDNRFSKDAHWRIDLNTMDRKVNVNILNDLEAAAYGLVRINLNALPVLLKASQQQTQFTQPPKILVSIGTGIGHAYVCEKHGWPTHVQKTHGGWILPFGANAEHQKIIELMRSHKDRGRDMTMEDIVSGHGLWTLQDLIGRADALRLFWEFLGLYCNTLATVSGGYGGIYLTGGIIDDMAADDTFDVDSFKKFFIRPLAPSVVESLSSTPVYYCHDVNLPILGLAEYRKVHG